jgi:hypothetical protein
VALLRKVTSSSKAESAMATRVLVFATVMIDNDICVFELLSEREQTKNEITRVVETRNCGSKTNE